jgi:NAD(P)-dependent dehydrogenase (short-subunit alcohol dehydrogenase family)
MSEAKKIILVTGANRGIGFEIVRQLAVLNHTVILTARDEARGYDAVGQLKKQNLKAHFLQLDVTNSLQREHAKEKIEKEFGTLDVLINNAGIGVKGDKNLVSVKPDVWDQTMETNAKAPLMLATIFSPIMPKGSRIINISSGGGSMTDPVGGWSPVYCISKSTLNAITRHLAYSLSQSGISVNSLCPGWVKTDMGTSAAPRSVEHGADTAIWLATTDHIPTGKFWRDRKEIPW